MFCVSGGSWRINRKLEVSSVKKTTGGSRIHYDVVGGDHIGSEIQIIERGRNNDINELVSKWLDNGDTTPLTYKMFNDFFERHEGEKLTVRDIHQSLHLSRKGLTEKDVVGFLSETVNPVTTYPYVYNLGISGNETLVGISGNETLVGTFDNNFQPLSPKTILDHYRHPLVTAAILQCSSIGSSWRAGNFDFTGWWKRVDTATDKLEKLYVLPDPNDYHLLIEKGRSLYWTLNFFEESVKTQERIHPDKGVMYCVRASVKFIYYD